MLDTLLKAAESFRKDADVAQKLSAKAKTDIDHAYNRGRADALREAARWMEGVACVLQKPKVAP